MPVPSFTAFIEPLLHVLSDHPDGIASATAYDAVAARLALSQADRGEFPPSGAQPVYKNRCGWAHDRLKRAGLSESASRGVWRLTPNGVRYWEECGPMLSADELRRITDIKDERQSSLWRERLAAYRADGGWVAKRAQSLAERSEILPKMQDAVRCFLTGEVDGETFRTEFDRETRRHWKTFGFSGMGGAMVLNQVIKYAPDVAEAERELRKLVALPQDEEAAAGALRGFAQYLASARERLDSEANVPGTGRLGFFASIFWHLQDPENWPCAYPSSRDALERDGLFEADAAADFAAAYLSFREAFLDLSRALDLTAWDLESLLLWSSLSEVPHSTDESAAASAGGPRVWLIALGRDSTLWQTCHAEGVIVIGWPKVGDLSQFTALEQVRDRLREDYPAKSEPTNNARACWEFAHEIRVGDEVFVKRGRQAVLGYGIVRSDYRHEPERGDMPHVRSVTWLNKGEWRPREKLLSMKTLTEVTNYPALVAALRTSVGAAERKLTDSDEGDGEAGLDEDASPEPYALEDAAGELFVSREELEEMLELLRYKKNLILKGPPGVGKTFLATRLAYLLVGAKSEKQIERVQFHPSFSYEDFVQGLRPTETGGFARQDGPLLRFCKVALEDQKSPYVLIIDEINRGNVSKIFGELLSLIESDKRELKYGLTLAYAREGEPRFHLPPELYIIGTMNTADRSLALVDYALRRRFVFKDLAPCFVGGRFKDELLRLGVDAALRTAICERVGKVNEVIATDASLGAGFLIGHSYFCQGAGRCDEDWYDRIVRFEILPLLEELWFDNRAKVDECARLLQGED